MKPTKEPREKKPRVWKAWAIINDGEPGYCLTWQVKPPAPKNKRYRVIEVTITERKP